MANDDTNYRKEAVRDAADMASEFLDDLLEQIQEDGEASDDLSKIGADDYHHESHVDRSYSLLEAAQVLDQLDQYEETDSGLWEGVEDPKRAVETMAAFTYGNAVYGQWSELIGDINDQVKGESFAEGPKDWSPIKKNVTLKEFVKQIIKEFRD